MNFPVRSYRVRLGALVGALMLVTGGSASAASWVPGDLHVHTCYSHDVYCGPGDDNTGPDTFYSSAGTVAERFLEAKGKGLAFIAITDHNDVRAQSDPDFGTQGVIGLRAYEASLAGGHAQMLGATSLYPGPATASHAADAAAVAANADALDSRGGDFQANHPAYKGTAVFDSCAQADIANWDSDLLFWRYGYSVLPDTIEVWNPTTLLPPSERYWECWLQRGARIGATGGSDSHGANYASLGNPTTWVLAAAADPSSIFAALRQGRTTISRLSPSQGGSALLLEADANGDGTYESIIGDTVRPGTKMRVRTESPSAPGLVRVRANGQTLLDGAALAPGGQVTFTAPAGGAGWVRASETLPQPLLDADPGCVAMGQPYSTCLGDQAMAGMTSPIYLDPAAPAGGSSPRIPETVTSSSNRPKGSAGPSSDATAHDANEPDRDPALKPSTQSGHGADLGKVEGGAGGSGRLRLTRRAFHAGWRLRWSGPAERFGVQVRVRTGHRGAMRWRTLVRATRTRGLLWPGRHPAAFRLRVVKADGSVGPWLTRTVSRPRRA